MPNPAELSTLVVVDGHNLLNDVGRQVHTAAEPWWIGLEPEIRKRYYRDWFDIDRLVEATIGREMEPWRDLGIVVFHSNKAVGDKTSELRLEGTFQDAFWARQGGNPNTATNLVEIQGAPSGKDAGMDTTIVVYMFETVDRWDAAVLFSNDSDFVPAVWALRRRGKRVFCAAPVGDRDSPLVRACQHFYHWNLAFLCADRLLFACTRKGGAFDQVLSLAFLREGECKLILTSTGVGFSGPPQHQPNSTVAKDIDDVLGRYDLKVVPAGTINYGEGTRPLYLVEPKPGPAASAWSAALKTLARHASSTCTETLWFSRAHI